MFERFKKQDKSEVLLEQLVSQQNDVRKLIEAGFNSANLLAMKQSLERVEEKMVVLEGLNQRITDLNSHITKLIDMTATLSITLGKLSMRTENKIIEEPKSQVIVPDKVSRMFELRKNGLNYSQIAREIGVTRQYVHKIIKEFLPSSS